MARGEKLYSPIEVPDHAGKPLHEWSFPEFVQHERGRTWYIASLVIMLLFLLFAFWEQNYLFALIIVLLAIIFSLQGRRKPQQMYFGIYEGGITFHKKYFPYENLKQFWIIFQPPDVKSLYFSFKTIRPDLIISLGEQNPLTIRDTLLRFVQEDIEREKENSSNELTRLLKL